jgi:hypothetical protein
MYTCHNFCICPQNDLELLFVCSYSYLFAVERKDQKTLEKLRAERKAKIDELKENKLLSYPTAYSGKQTNCHYSININSLVAGIKFYHVSCHINTEL